MPVYLLSDELIFPPADSALGEGLLAVGGDLSADRILLAYRSGIFPWYTDEDPAILWWSPDPRLVLYPRDLRISRSLARTIRKGKFTITMDTRFEQVLRACARTGGRRLEGTWITEAMARAYIDLHRLGFAHSVEAWFEGEVVGGLYGISLGGCFFGESMFSTMSDASKVALVHLRDFLVPHGVVFIDCQLPTDHLERLGARRISRKTYLSQLAQALRVDTLKGFWRRQS